MPVERGKLNPYVDLVQTSAPISPGNSGDALVGARVVDLWPELQREFRTKARTGALVVEVSEGSPAAKAGIAPGDVIVSVAGVRIPNADVFLSELAHRRPGTRVGLKLTTLAGLSIDHSVMLGDQAKQH